MVEEKEKESVLNEGRKAVGGKGKGRTVLKSHRVTDEDTNKK